jgi:hypothetical protein
MSAALAITSKPQVSKSARSVNPFILPKLLIVLADQ